MCIHTRQVVGHRDPLLDWERNAYLPRSYMAGARREIDLYGWTGLFAIWEVWLTHEAASQCPLQGRKEAQTGREKKKIALLFCHTYWVGQKVPSSFPIRCYEKAQRNVLFGQPSISNKIVCYTILSVIRWSDWRWRDLFVMTAQGNLGCR